jgi:hypothetical protein
LASCAHPESGGGRGVVGEGNNVSAPFDVGAVIRSVHFAYNRAGSDFVAGDETYAVRVLAESRVAITPQMRSQGTTVATGAPVSFETTSIARAGASTSLGAAARVDGDGSLLIDRGVAAERLRDGEDGVEQSWTFARAPAGGGDLTIRIAATGEQYIGATSSGLHFADAQTGLGVRYGTATWIDARGARTSVASSYEGGAIVLTVPEAIVESSAYPAVLDPTIGSEFGIDTPVTAPAPRNQSMAQVAFDGTNYLVVWTDGRNGVAQVVGARVTRAGAVLEPSGILIASGANSLQPALAFDGANYLVVWRDARNLTTSGNDIYGTRVSKAGAVLDGTGFAISTATDDQSRPRVMFGGSTYLVVWEDARNLENAISTFVDIYGARVSKAGALLDSTGIAISNGPDQQFSPSLSFDGTNFFVVWQDYRDTLVTGANIMGARVSPAGVLGDGPPDFGGIAISNAATDQFLPEVAFDGTNYLVVWEDSRNFASNGDDIFATRVSKAGVVLDGTTTGIAISTAANDQRIPTVKCDGVNCLVVWDDKRSGTSRDIYGTRVSRPGVLIDGPSATGGIPISTASDDQVTPTLVFDGTGYFVTWEDFRNDAATGGDIFAARVATSGTVLDLQGRLVSTIVTNTESHPAVGFDGTRYLVVWQDNRGTLDNDIFGALVSPTGTLLTPAFDISNVGASDQIRPSVAFDGTRYLVAWMDFRNGVDFDVYGALVSTLGGVISGSGIVIRAAPGDQSAPAVAATSGQFLVVWQDLESGHDYDIVGSIVTGATGTATTFTISGAPEDQLAPAVASSGSSFLVAWEDYSAGTGFADIHGRRVDASNGRVTGAEIVVSDADNHQLAPSIDFDGKSNYLVVWQDERNTATTGGDVYGARVSTTGSVVDGSGIAISTAAGEQTNPVVVFDLASQRHLAVWEDGRSGTQIDLFGTELTTKGAVTNAAGIAIATEANDKLSPTLVGNAKGQVMVAYQRYVPSLAAQRARARFVALP